MPGPTAHADVVGCLGLFSQSALQPDSQTSVNLQVNNGSGDAIQWIKVSRPNGTVTVIGASSDNWSYSTDDNSVIFTGSNLAPGDAYNRLYITMQTSANESEPASWTVQASSDSSGAHPVTCDDAGLQTSVNDGAGPLISGLLVDAIQGSSVHISWETDEPSTTQVAYGPTFHYGNTTALDPSLTTEHTVTLSGLTPNTGYHFQALSNDGADNESASSDSTFLTSSATAAADTTAPITKIPIKAVPTEHVPPTISLTTTLAKFYKTPPTLSGTAADNEALADVSYSLDDGLNWAPADTVTGLGGKSATFSFTPTALDDGNYSLLVRAVDTSGNITTTQPVTLVIDRLDPMVGGFVVSAGPQLLLPDKNEQITTVRGMNQKISLSAVGGPTQVVLNAYSLPAAKILKAAASFSLTKSTDSGLWSGLMSFTAAGDYEVVADAVDGAGNTTHTLVSKVRVAEPGKVIDQSTKAGIKATVTVYYFEPVSGKWVVWDGAAYGQLNPQTTDSKGTFQYLLPAGKFYLKAESANHHVAVSNIFSLSSSRPVSSTLELKPEHMLHFGPVYLRLPDLTVSHLHFASDQTRATKVDTSVVDHADLLNKLAPNFTLQRTNGATVRTTDLLGRPTLLTFASSWLPTINEQLGTLAALQTNKDINIVPVALQESASRITAYSGAAGYELNWLVDSQGSLSTTYCPCALPTHYFIDRSGYIRKITTGVLTREQITDTLSSL